MLAFFFSLIDDDVSRSQFEMLYIQHRHTMLSVASKILKDPYLSEDAVHEAFLRILKHLEKIRELDYNKERAYIVIVVKNISIDMVRKKKALAESDLDEYGEIMWDSRSGPEQIFLDKEAMQAVLKAVSTVKKPYLDTLSLQMSYGFNNQEIAHLLRLSAPVVRIRLHRGRKMLIKSLKEDNFYVNSRTQPTTDADPG